MAKAGDLSHCCHTAAGPVDDAYRLQFWQAVEQFAPEALTALLQTADIDGWARKHNLTLAGSVPGWVIRGAEEIQRIGRADGIDHCPPGPPVVSTRLLYSGVTLISGPASDPDQWIKVESRAIFNPFWQRSKAQRREVKETILRDCERQTEAEFERIGRSFQPAGPWKNEEYFELFVKFQVNGTRVRELISPYCISRDTDKLKEWSDWVRIGLRRIAALLGLDLAKKASGRPSHSK